MTQQRIFTPLNRLNKGLTENGGRTAEEMLASANTRLAGLVDTLREAVAVQLARIMAMQNDGETPLGAKSLALGDAALNIAEIAGAAGMPALGEAARGLHAMVDGMLAKGEWREEAASLHVSALALLGAPNGLPAADAAVMLNRLQAMRQAVGVQD